MNKQVFVLMSPVKYSVTADLDYRTMTISLKIPILDYTSYD